jgi:hypothetical protein
MSTQKASKIEPRDQNDAPADVDALALNPFANLETLRVDQNFAEQAVAKKLLTTVPIGKPNRQTFVRVRPEPKYCMDLACIELKEDGELYIVSPAFARQIPEHVIFCTFFTTISRQGVLSLWPVPLPSPDGRRCEWHISARLAAEIAMTKWIRISSNRALGAYEIHEAKGLLDEPAWPEESYAKILEIAFRGRPIVDSFEHPVMKRLCGAT